MSEERRNKNKKFVLLFIKTQTFPDDCPYPE